jgi:hypothetical protein
VALPLAYTRVYRIRNRPALSQLMAAYRLQSFMDAPQKAEVLSLDTCRPVSVCRQNPLSLVVPGSSPLAAGVSFHAVNSQGASQTASILSAMGRISASPLP